MILIYVLLTAFTWYFIGIISCAVVVWWEGTPLTRSDLEQLLTMAWFGPVIAIAGLLYGIFLVLEKLWNKIPLVQKFRSLNSNDIVFKGRKSKKDTK